MLDLELLEKSNINDWCILICKRCKAGKHAIAVTFYNNSIIYDAEFAFIDDCLFLQIENKFSPDN